MTLVERYLQLRTELDQAFEDYWSCSTIEAEKKVLGLINRMESELKEIKKQKMQGKIELRDPKDYTKIFPWPNEIVPLHPIHLPLSRNTPIAPLHHSVIPTEWYHQEQITHSNLSIRTPQSLMVIDQESPVYYTAGNETLKKLEKLVNPSLYIRLKTKILSFLTAVRVWRK